MPISWERELPDCAAKHSIVAQFIIVRLLSDGVIQALLEVYWWNWVIKKITHNLEKTVTAEIEALINCE